MLRLIALVPLTLSGAALAQAAGGPEIAYIKAGSVQEIYLINRDSSGLTRLYSAPRKTGLGWLDIKPGGNELAFMQGLKIRIQKFHDSGQRDGDSVELPSPCGNAQSPDYHPSGDGSFVFIAPCGFGNFQVLKRLPGTTQSQLLFTVPSANRIRWSRTGDFLYYDQADSPTSSVARLKRRSVASGAVDDLGVLDDLNNFEVTRTGDRLVHGSSIAPKLFDFAVMSDTSQSAALGCEGDDLHFSPGDSQMVYETPHSARGTYVLIKNGDCSGSVNALTGKGEWHKKDWRPDPVAP